MKSEVRMKQRMKLQLAIMQLPNIIKLIDDGFIKRELIEINSDINEVIAQMKDCEQSEMLIEYLAMNSSKN